MKRVILKSLCALALVLSGAVIQASYSLLSSPKHSSVPVITPCSHSTELDSLKDRISSLEREISSLSTQKSRLETELQRLSAITPPSEKQVMELIRKSPSNINQGIDPSQLRSLIKSVLSYLGEKEQKWIDLLMLTCQTESHLGRNVCQIKGPAKGIFQVEPATEREVWKHYIDRQPKLKDKVAKLRFPAKLTRHEMEYNMAYSIALTYSIYKWRKVNPSKMTITELAKIHKLKFNSLKGAATVQKTFVKLWGTNII